MRVRNYFNPGDISKRKLTFAIKKLKEDPLWGNEMLTHTDTYLDYIRDVSIKLPAVPFVEVEKRVDFSKYVPEGFGTADCIMIQGNTLFVIDFKYGKGVPVSAEENPQMMLYALGAYEACKILYPITKIHLGIVQPRLPDGISNWECSLRRSYGVWRVCKRACRGLCAFLEKESLRRMKRPVSSAGQRINVVHGLITT